MSWREWPEGWHRNHAFRVINFLGKNSSDTYQVVTGPLYTTFYFRRRGDTGELEIRFRKVVTRVSPNGFMHDEPLHTSRFTLIRQALKITNI